MHALAGPVLAFALASQGFTAGDAEWHRARSAHFEVLSDAGEPVARHAIERLEALRTALQALFPPRTAAERRIVAFVLARSERFDSLVPRRHAQPRRVAGFFQGGAESDTIVARLTVERRGPFAALDHEYAHVVLNHSLPAQPLWVAEGLAELLSDGTGVEAGGPRSVEAGSGIRPGGAGGGMPPADEAREVRFGSFHPDLAALARETPRPLSSLLDLGPDSPEYLAVRDTGLYGRSWALARWVVARHGLAGLRSFLEAVADGEAARLAFEVRLAPLDEAQATLLDVAPGPLLRVPLAGVPMQAAAATQVDAPSLADVEYRLGELLLRTGDTAGARLRLERALAEAPGHLPARIALADVELRRGAPASARLEVQRALDASPNEPAALLYDARLQIAEARTRGEPLAPELEDRLVSQLERALERAPGLYEAALLLADLRPQPYARRRAALEPVFEQDPARTEVALALASLHVKERDLSAAQRVLRRAREAAIEPAYRFLCERQLDLIAEYRAATVEVRGRLIHLDCRSDGSLRFTVDAPPSPIVLAAASTRAFFVHGEAGETGESDLVCGLQDREVVVRYWRADDPGRNQSGVVLWLAFPGRPAGR